MAASLKDCGTKAEDSEEFMMVGNSGRMVGRQGLIRAEGMGSNGASGVFNT